MVLISIVIPVFNVEQFLPKCIESVLAQTYCDFELILVDDGSTDNSGLICDNYKKNDERIKVIHKNNGGLSSARNVGIDVSSGEYIAFIDGDDYISPAFLELLKKSIDNNNCDIAACNFVFVDENGKEIKKVLNEEKLVNKVFTEKNIKNIPLDKNRISFVIAVNKLYKKNLFNGIRYPIGRLHEDEWIIHHILGSAKSLCTISDQLYFYVQRENSIIHYKNNVRPFKSRVDAYYALLDRYNFAKKKHWNAAKRNSSRGCMHIFLRILEEYPKEQNFNFASKEIKTISIINPFSFFDLKLKITALMAYCRYRRKAK